MSGPGRDDVLVDERVAVRRFVLNDLLTNGFVVQDRESEALLVVDPGARGEALVEAAREWGGDVRWVLVTHHHGDHWADLDVVVDALGAPVAGPGGGGFAVDRSVAGGETLPFGTLDLRVAATPGHSPESVTYFVDGHAFIGDFLFRLASGRTDGAGASTGDLFEAMRGVFAEVPDETVLWCGHGPPTTVGEERAGNPFWRIAVDGEPERPVDEVVYRDQEVGVLAWADDYDGGRKALLALEDGSRVIVPSSQVTTG